jgi:tRNA uridine 5-carboxymethylaminomethyl modification enzyme
MDRSPMYTGVIEGVGPRYCPSIEDKVVRFADKDSHQIFVEPEGLTPTRSIPTASPPACRSMCSGAGALHPGFEQAHITRPGYAIEYDYFDPRDLRLRWRPNSSSRACSSPARSTAPPATRRPRPRACWPGLNAARGVQERSAWWPGRDEAYLGVLVDDLITRGTQRALPHVHQPRRVPAAAARGQCRSAPDRRPAAAGPGRLRQVCVRPADLTADSIERLGEPLRREVRALDLLARPECDHALVCAIGSVGPDAIDADLRDQVVEQVEIQARYSGYIDRQRDEVERARRAEAIRLPGDLDYAGVKGLSAEVSEKLSRHRPQTIGQAGRIPGVTPAAVSLLLIHLKKRSA